MNWKQFASKEKGTLSYQTYVYEKEIGGSQPKERKAIMFYDDVDNIVFEIRDDGDFNFYNFSNLGVEFSENVVKFINQGPEEWFKGSEKKYYIIIGKDSDGIISAYRKYSNIKYGVDAYAELHGEQQEPYYEFTEKEIDDLKSTLPDNMSKIVELGKTEVNE